MSHRKIDSMFLSAVSRILKDFDLKIGRDVEIDMVHRQVNITADLSFETITEVAHALEDAVGKCCS